MTATSSTTSQETCAASQVDSRARFWIDGLRTDLPPGIVFRANVGDGSEDAEENRAAALALGQSQTPTQLVPLETPDCAERLLPKPVRNGLERLTFQRVDPARSILYQAGIPPSWNLDFYGRARIGRTAFGTDRIPDGWVERRNAMDEIWVPSEFNRETFARSGVEEHKIRVLHTGIDTQLFRPDLPPLDIPRTHGFTFLSATDGRRQCGADVLLRAYLREFKPGDDVTLILRIFPHNESFIDLEAELIFLIETELGARLENTPTLIFLDAPLSQTDRARLYTSASAFVLPSRGEAWGRSCLEALASGLPVVAPQWGGNSEFLHDDNSFPIEAEGIVSTSLDDELVAGHRWAEPSLDHLRQRMREVFSNSREMRARATQGRKDAIEYWDWNVVMADWAREFGRRCE